MDDDLIFRNEKLFFSIVHTTGDDVEALDLLRRAKSAVLFDKEALNTGGNFSQDQAINKLLTKLNDETKYVHTRINRQDWHKAVKQICGPEQYYIVLQMLADMRDQRTTP